MNKNHKIEIRVSAKEKENLLRDAEVLGFKSLSAYIRSTVCSNKLIYQKILDEIILVKKLISQTK